jgi:hypothetical protein
VNRETWIRVRPPQTDPILETIVTRRVIASPPPESHRPKAVGRIQVNPTDLATVESTEVHLDLVDWCLENRRDRTPSPVDDRDRIQWLEKLLRWNVNGMLRDPMECQWYVT